MKVKLTPKPKQRYKLTVEIAFDNAPTKSHSIEGPSEDISKFMDATDNELDGWEREMDNAKEHVTRVEFRVVRL